ncbi:hypothetical protein T484DRAFT_1778225, partial [Baffinella frigidus]
YSAASAAVLASTCLACPALSTSVAGSAAQAGCVCNVGYSGVDGGSCVGCVTGKYKSVNGSSLCVTCPTNSDSAGVASDQLTGCVCKAGFLGSNGGPCITCVANSYCIAGVATSCPDFSSSPEGSGLKTACTCDAGYFGANGGTCES